MFLKYNNNNHFCTFLFVLKTEGQKPFCKLIRYNIIKSIAIFSSVIIIYIRLVYKI